MNLDASMMLPGEKERPFNWDIVSIPVQADRPNAGGVINVNEVVVINKNTSNLETAKDFVNYITSDEVAKVKVETNIYGFIPRVDYVKQQGLELNYEAFYKLEPIENVDPIPTELVEKYQDWWNLLEIYQSNFTRMLNDEVDLDTALQQAQIQMDEELQQIIAEMDDSKGTNDNSTK